MKWFYPLLVLRHARDIRRLEEAALLGDVEVVRHLVELGVPVDGRGNAAIETPLAAAAVNGRLKVVQLLLASGADPNGAGSSRPPLCAASPCGSGDRLEVIRALLDAGADPSRRDYNHMTPLMLAVHDPEAVTLLLSRGAQVDAQDERGHTALMQAAMDGCVESVRRLLAAGADAKLLDRQGRNALHLAAYRSETGTVQALLACGLIDANAPDHEGRTPLHYAAGVELRARAGVMMRLAPNALTADRETLEARHRALIDRLETAALPVIDVLLAAGGDMDRRNASLPTLVWLAEREGLWKIRARLLQGTRGSG